MSAASLLRKRFTWFIIAAVALIVVAFARREDTPKETQQSPDAIPVEVTKVNTEPLTETVSAVGTVSALHDVNVGSETAGRVTHVLFNLGDVVHAGQTLVVVDDELKAAGLDQAKAQALAAETSYDKAKHDFARAESLYQSHDIADVELEGNRLALHSAEAQYKGAQAALRAAARQMSDTRIKSPIDGVVASKRIELGEMVAPGREVANIVDIATVKIKLGIPEESIAKVVPQLKAALRIDARPDLRFDGTVCAVGSKTESPTGHTYPVEVLVKNTRAHDLKVGMFVRVDIATKALKSALSIPVESVVNGDIAPHVFVVDRGVARLRPVTLGIRSADKYQILTGLQAGETIVSFGQKDLKDGAAVLVK